MRNAHNWAQTLGIVLWCGVIDAPDWTKRVEVWLLLLWPSIVCWSQLVHRALNVVVSIPTYAITYSNMTHNQSFYMEPNEILDGFGAWWAYGLAPKSTPVQHLDSWYHSTTGDGISRDWPSQDSAQRKYHWHYGQTQWVWGGGRNLSGFILGPVDRAFDDWLSFFLSLGVRAHLP